MVCTSSAMANVVPRPRHWNGGRDRRTDNAQTGRSNLDVARRELCVSHCLRPCDDVTLYENHSLRPQGGRSGAHICRARARIK